MLNYLNYVKYIVNYIVGVKGLLIEKFIDKVLKNVKRLFKINV